MDINTAREMGAGFIRRSLVAQDFKEVFGGPVGERALYEIMNRGGVLSVNQFAGDAYTSGFNDGKRALALEILEILRFDESKVIELARRRDEAERQAA